MIEKFDSSKERIIQEFVPGKQITLAHIIPNPPSEGAIIAADVASKAGGIKIGFVDRFNGTLIITGEVASVEAAMNGVIAKLCDYMGFAKPEITQS